MFGFGFTEMALIVLVAVMLFPARELPKIARGVAKLYGQVRRTADDFRASILEDEDLNAPIREIRTVYNEARYEVQRTREQTQREIAKARMEARMEARKLQAELGGGSERTSRGTLGSGSAAAAGAGAVATAPAIGAGTHGEPGHGAPAHVGSDAGARGPTDQTGPEPSAGPAEPSAGPAEPSAGPAEKKRAPREVLVSATAGTNRKEDAPPGRAAARSKLAFPPGLAPEVRPASGRVARETPAAPASTMNPGSTQAPDAGTDAPEASASDARASAEQGVA